MGTRQRTAPRRPGARAAVQRGAGITSVLGIGGLIIAGLVVTIGVVVFNAANPDDTATPPTAPLVTPANLTPGGAIPVGKPDAPVTVEIFLDYMCPACGRFEQANARELDRLIQAGTVRLELRPISFLDRTSQGTRYSTRAANAVATVADRSPDKVLAFNHALYANQPQEGTRGLSDERIAELATGVGVGSDVVDAFDDRTFEPWVATMTEAAFGSGVPGTPTVKINGKVFDGDVYRPGPLTDAIQAAAGSPR